MHRWPVPARGYRIGAQDLGLAPRPSLVPELLGGATVVRVVDLERSGFARSTVAHRCRAGGPWRWLLPGVVQLHNGPPDRATRRRAALLYCGTGVLTGLDALDLHGMRRMPSPSGPVHVLVPAAARRIGAGLVLVERTERLPAAAPGRWPLAPAARAALDFTRRSRDRAAVRATIAEVVQRGRCTPGELNVELAAGSGRGSALPREVLREISDGVRSVAEAEARKLALRSGLPAPLAWEIDSLEWHLGPEDYEITLDRRAAMMAEGIVVVHHLPKKLSRRPAAGAGPGRPARRLHPRRSPPAPPGPRHPPATLSERHSRPMRGDGSAVRPVRGAGCSVRWAGSGGEAVQLPGWGASGGRSVGPWCRRGRGTCSRTR